MKLRRGISLVEVTISMVIVSMTSLAVIQLFGVTAKTRALSSDRTRGLHLAAELLAEIQAQHWTDPESGITSFGVRMDEYDGKTRTRYNDIDDYHGWEQSPPLLPDGTEVPGFSGWKRSVTVQYATLDNGSIVTSGIFQRGKLITVTVSRAGREIAQLTAYRSLDFDLARLHALPPNGEVLQ